jgi:hypothetical protein
MEDLEKLSFCEYMDKHMKEYWNWFYSLSNERQELELDRATRWYNER